jgi:SAM-dependent methyltransferase
MTLRATSVNSANYDSYYAKPWWWFLFRYDTQIKTKTVRWLLRSSKSTPQDCRVLEIGFGSGMTLFSFARRCEICGVETSRSAVEAARQRASKKLYRAYDFLLMEGDTLSFPDSSFGVAIASHVLEHVPDDALLMSEIMRALCAGGVFVALVPINERFVDVNHVRHYTSDTIRELGKRIGFEEVSVQGNETLAYLVERFYCLGYDRKWGVWGRLIAGVFNFATSWWPFFVYRMLDQIFYWFGYKPRQVGVVFRKPLTLK